MGDSSPPVACSVDFRFIIHGNSEREKKGALFGAANTGEKSEYY